MRMVMGGALPGGDSDAHRRSAARADDVMKKAQENFTNRSCSRSPSTF